MKKLFIMAMVMLSIATAKNAAAQSNHPKFRIQIGPEGDSSLYFWRRTSKLNTGGRWYLANDSSDYIMKIRGMEEGYYVSSPKGKIKFLKVKVSREEVTFFFDGYWRLCRKEDNL